MAAERMQQGIRGWQARVARRPAHALHPSAITGWHRVFEEVIAGGLSRPSAPLGRLLRLRSTSVERWSTVCTACFATALSCSAEEQERGGADIPATTQRREPRAGPGPCLREHAQHTACDSDTK
ncbi:unnamed protein product [Prorocentrum cordatum]|uniref:Uncharacterized protein n=1 Tax=Prorocentrum cordatum TaxID=2364126 RepID=A0ABN9PA09_9DINO|nr:unnamed protein product [Polarella glacialis]